jgi:hypothetical protein
MIILKHRDLNTSVMFWRGFPGSAMLFICLHGIAIDILYGKNNFGIVFSTNSSDLLGSR